MTQTYLNYLEDESVYIIREAIAEFDNPVFLYSIGKDSSVLLHLILKAYYPATPTLPLLHIDTRWKFKEMIEFRDKVIAKHNLNLLTYTNPQGIEDDIGPISHGSQEHTHIMKTEALKQVLNKYKFNMAFGGARRDEDKSRAKERIFSFRNKFHLWDTKNQRPELFNHFNSLIKQNESMRVFPLSNWTELDVWRYIKQESIDIVPLYYAKTRPIIEIDNTKIMIDDDRLPITENIEIKQEKVRFRTLGCYPLTGAINSEADTLDKIIAELESSRHSERQGRLIDADNAAAMEEKKIDGYF